MKPFSLGLLILWGLAFSVSSAGTSNIQCPSASEIKRQKISQAVSYLPGLYMGVEENLYHTAHIWRFNIGPIMAHTEAQVIKRANQEIQNLSGPISSASENGTILCIYQTHNPTNSAIASPISP